MKSLFQLFALSVVLLQIVRSRSSSASTAACDAALPIYLSDVEAGRAPNPFPIPSSSFAPQTRAVGYNLNKLRHSVYTIESGNFFSMLIYRGNALIALGSPEGGGFAKRDGNGAIVGTLVSDAVLEVLNGSTPKSFDLIYSHSHFDHIGASTLLIEFIKKQFPQIKIQIWASTGIARSIQASTSGRAPKPTRVFRKNVFLKLGSLDDPIRLNLKVVGGHTEDDVLTYIVKDSEDEPGVIFLVDMIFPGWAPFRGFGLSQNLGQYIRAHDVVLSLDFEVYVGCHLTRTGTREDVMKNKRFTESVIDAARRSLSIAPSTAEVSRNLSVLDPESSNFNNFWLGFDKQLQAFMRVCSNIVVREWGCKLAAVDVQAPEKCFVARNFITIDDQLVPGRLTRMTFLDCYISSA